MVSWYVSASCGNTTTPARHAVQMRATLAPPVRPGDEVTATVTIKEVAIERQRVVLDTVCTVGGKAVIEGEATVMFPSRKPK